MKVLTTGISGMVSSHLAEYVLNNHPSEEFVCPHEFEPCR